MENTLAINGGEPVRREKMPARCMFSRTEHEALLNAAKYYYEREQDPPYQGIFEERFCNAFNDYMGGGYSDAVATGTAAVYVAIAALDLPKGSEIVISPVTDSGPLNCIILQGFLPVLSDSVPNSYNTNIDQIFAKVSPTTSAILLVHTGGEPVADTAAIAEEARRRQIFLLEDCSQAPGATLDGRKVGTFGDLAAFSTMYAKSLAVSGSGGLVYTKDSNLFRKVRSYADRGKQPWRTDIDLNNPEYALFPALNFNTDEFSCAVGEASLRRLDETIARRVAFLHEFVARLTNASEVCLPSALHNGFSPFFFPVLVKTEHLSCSKVDFAKAVIAEGIPVKPHYGCVIAGWEWARPFFAKGMASPNAIAMRDCSFNLLLHENYSIREASEAVEAICKVEGFYRR